MGGRRHHRARWHRTAGRGLTARSPPVVSERFSVDVRLTRLCVSAGRPIDKAGIHSVSAHVLFEAGPDFPRKSEPAQSRGTRVLRLEAILTGTTTLILIAMVENGL